MAKIVVKTPQELLKATRDIIVPNADKRQELFTKVKEAYVSKHKSGSITPALKQNTIIRKRKKGYSKPNAPLYASGQLADGIFMGKNDETMMQIVARSHVLPSWHWSHRPKGVPKRRALEPNELGEIGKEVL